MLVVFSVLFAVCCLLLDVIHVVVVVCCIFLFGVCRVLLAVWCLVFVDVLRWLLFNLLMYMRVGVSLVVCYGSCVG